VPSGQYPDQYVYMVPNRIGLYFYQGIWYRNNGGYWYSSPVYDGSWTPIWLSVVPSAILSIPLDYALYLPSGYHRIHYRDYHRHWRVWKHRRYWHHQNWYRYEMRTDVRRERMRRVEQHRSKIRNAPQVRAKRNERLKPGQRMLRQQVQLRQRNLRQQVKPGQRRLRQKAEPGLNVRP
jgi:hypothetical protein